MIKPPLLLVALSALCVVQASAQIAIEQGPLGLSWGTSAGQVRTLGIELKELPNADYGVSFASTKLPLVLSDQEAAIISFGYDDRLWRIVAVSKPFPNDPYGTNLKLRYQQLLTTLTDKYGTPSSVHSLGDSIFQQPEYFLAGLREGRTNWYSNFATPTLSIQLNLFADDSSTGRWRIIYEDKALRKAFDNSKKAKEKNAL